MSLSVTIICHTGGLELLILFIVGIDSLIVGGPIFTRGMSLDFDIMVGTVVYFCSNRIIKNIFPIY